MNFLTKLSLAAGAVLVAAILMAAGIYYIYIARPAENAPQTAAFSPAPVGADREPALPPTQPLIQSPPQDPQSLVSAHPEPVEGRSREVGNLDNDPYAPSVGAHRDAPSTQQLVPRLSKAPTPAANPASTIVLPAAPASPTPPPPVSIPYAPSAGATLVAAPTPLVLSLSQDPPEPVKGPTAGSDDQVQFIPKKETLKYPNLGSQLNQLVASVEAGQATAQEAARSAPIHQDGAVAVTIHLSGKPDAVVRFLEDKGGDPRNVGEDYIEAYVPVTLLGQVSELSGVLRVREIIPPQPAGSSHRGGLARP